MLRFNGKNPKQYRLNKVEQILPVPPFLHWYHKEKTAMSASLIMMVRCLTGRHMGSGLTLLWLIFLFISCSL